MPTPNELKCRRCSKPIPVWFMEELKDLCDNCLHELAERLRELAKTGKKEKKK